MNEVCVCGVVVMDEHVCIDVSWYSKMQHFFLMWSGWHTVFQRRVDSDQHFGFDLLLLIAPFLALANIVSKCACSTRLVTESACSCVHQKATVVELDELHSAAV